MKFQTYVLIFFVILLLAILIFLGVTMNKNKTTNVPWPPIISSCPDFWTDTPLDGTSKYVPGSRCIGTMGNNTGNVAFDPINSKCPLNAEGKSTLTKCDPDKCLYCKTSTINFSNSSYCDKKKWANNKISWDGITYGYDENRWASC